MTAGQGIREGIYQSGLVRRVAQWLDAPPHPPVVCEIAADHVTAAHWSRTTWALESFAIQPLSPDAIAPTAVETNLLNATEVRSAVAKVFAQLGVKGQEVALLVPDPIVRVFVLHFDSFPRTAAEAVPLLRWRLKKSVPFEAEETLISFMRQAPREDGVDIVTGLARLRIIREYEQLLESAGMTPGVVMSSTLAAIPLLDDARPSLLARVSGKSLTTAIAREGILCGYRCTDLPSRVAELSPQALLDEIYPVAAYYQDSWSEGIASVRLAGLGSRAPEFRGLLERELGCPVSSLLVLAATEGRIGPTLHALVDHDLDSLIGWTQGRV
jgi:type IV pilus assembly protein PilM